MNPRYIMRNNLIQLFLTIACCLLPSTVLQAQTATDTVFNPTVVYSSMPRTYEIAAIRVEGAPNYSDQHILGIAGLKVGDHVGIPGDDITAAAKRLMRQGLFSQARFVLEKTADSKAWLLLKLTPQPRISQVNYIGMKKSEREELQNRLNLMKGNQITQNIVNRAKSIVEKFFRDKGYTNAAVSVTLHEDLSAPGEMIVDIAVDRHDKIRVHKIYITGNTVMTDGKIKRVMKKTNENNDILKLFSQKKFVRSDYAEDLNLIIRKYNELGYRDARIVADSVVQFNENRVDVYITVDEGPRYFIKEIDWVGNTVYPTEVLNGFLGMKPGDVYNQTLMNKRLTEDDDAVSNLYMDRGYLFYDLVPVERTVSGDSITLEMRINEGPQARINNVIINGNDRLYEKVIRRELRVRPGDLFSKSDLQRSAREIAQTGHFNPESMDIRPEPNEENGTVDVVFNLESKANDQVEFSVGWGQTGIIGKLSLKFTNFSMKNLLYPSTYRGIIPQGEGQTFTISGQTNARYYNALSLSFLDPWFGGKRPNSLSLSAYYSQQTGINSAYFNNRYSQGAYYNPYGYGYGGYGYGYGYGSGYASDYYQNSYQSSYDPNKYIQMVGVNLGFGKRLNWPDDYFTFTAELGYTWYKLKNWDYLIHMQNGSSNSLVAGLTLARNSIDNPIYTRSGSQFSINVTATPPASLFVGNRDWKTLAEQSARTNTDTKQATAARKQLYEWIEYWKVRFKSRTYTPLCNADGTYTPVLMTRADFGLLGSYNRYIKSPFETFYVGGDGMSGQSTYATETIALRGYDNGALTPWGSEGYAYTRFAAEIHMPLMLQPTTTIYALAFLEGGNAWTSAANFNPFELKRSAGAGLRIFLPMVGMMGIDWGYGFDKVEGRLGGSHFHFILGQEF